nr:hypothetical protein [uncultured Rhodoferax sp.]
MRTRRKSLRKDIPDHGLMQPNRDAPALDAWLSRASNLSQPLLLCLAVFGYFYTVLPVYQKELLSEQIAEKEVELSRLHGTIAATTPTIEGLKAERAALEEQLRSLKDKKQATEHMVAELHARQSALESKNKELDASRASLTEEVATVEAAAKEFSMRSYHDSFAGSTTMQYLNGLSDPYVLLESPTYETISAYLLTPYKAVSMTLAMGDSRFIPSAASVTRAVKDEYHARVRAALEARKDALSKPQDDVNALLVHIKESLAAATIDPTPADRFNERLFETKRRLVALLHESRQREWDRTKSFLESVMPGNPK